MDIKKSWALAIFFFAVLSGAVMQMKGALLLSFQQTFSVSESLLGLIASAGTVGFLLAVLIIGMRAGKIDTRKFLLIGVGFTSIFIFLIGTSFSFFLLLVFLFGGGIATGIFRGLDRPLLSHLFPKRRGWIFNLHALAWAVGATLGPLFVNLILTLGSWRLTYFFLAFAFVPLFILIWKIRLPKSSGGERSLSLERLKEMLKKPVVIGMMLVIAVTTGIEGGFFTWLPYYANQFFPRTTANMVLSGYLAAYIPGIYIYSRLSGRVKCIDLVLLNSLVMVPLLFSAFVLTSGFLMLACIFAVGFLVSGVFPTMLAFGTNIFPEYSGPMNAMAMSSSALGISVFPMIMGVITDWYSIETAMQLLIFLMGGVAMIAFLLRRKIS